VYGVGRAAVEGEEETMNTLAEFLTEQAQQMQAHAPEWKKKRDEWVQAVNRLTDQLEVWVRRADAPGILDVERVKVTRREEGVGVYEVPVLAVNLGPRRVEVIPVARNTVGSVQERADGPGQRTQGRVDITNGIRKYLLYRLAGDAGEWVLLDELDHRPRPLDETAFGAALVSLLR
jgi:hypothetical protein